MVHTNSDSAKREKEAVTFAIRVRTMWYKRRSQISRSHFLVHTNSDSAKREKVCHLRIGIYYLHIIWNYYDLTKEKVSTGMVDEKVTVISSFSTWHFIFTEAGNAIAALGNIH